MLNEHHPYASPQAAGPAEERQARVTVRGRWYFMVIFTVSLVYRLMIGVMLIREMFFPGGTGLERNPGAAGRLGIMELILWWFLFLVTGVMTLHAIWNLALRRWSRTVFWTGLVASILSWAPFLILNVVTVILWILRRPGRFGAVAVDSASAVETRSVDELIRILKEEAMIRFEIGEGQFGLPLVGRLRVAPGEVNGFLYDLEADHGVSLVDEVDASSTSVQDMIDILASRRSTHF
jgi:hypothetical protein